MKLKAKIIVGALSVLLINMILSILVVAFVINQQNREASFQLLDKTFTVVRNALSETRDALVSNSLQTVTANDLGGKMKYVVDNQTLFKFQMMKTVYVEMTTALYNFGLASEIWKSRQPRWITGPLVW